VSEPLLYDAPMRATRIRALLAFALVVVTACADRTDSAGASSANAYCQDGWSSLSTVVALPDGSAWAGGSTCAQDAEHSLLRRWDGDTWTDVAIEDVSNVADLEVDPAGTVWGLATAPEPWRSGSAIIRIRNGVASVAEHLDFKASDLAIAPDGTRWLSGSSLPSTGDGPPADNPYPSVLRDVGGTWEDSVFMAVTTSNGGNETKPPSLLFLGDVAYAVGTAYADERPFSYLFRWNDDTWKRLRVPRNLPVGSAGAGTGSGLVFAGAFDGGPPELTTFDGDKEWTTEPVGTHSQGIWFAVAASDASVWVVSSDGEMNAPTPWAELRTGTGWATVPTGLDAGIRLADATVLPDGSVLAVGENCCRGDLPRDAVAVHLTI
jgi:hypothetical protein